MLASCVDQHLLVSSCDICEGKYRPQKPNHIWNGAHTNSQKTKQNKQEKCMLLIWFFYIRICCVEYFWPENPRTKSRYFFRIMCIFRDAHTCSHSMPDNILAHILCIAICMICIVCISNVIWFLYSICCLLFYVNEFICFETWHKMTLRFWSTKITL